MLRSATNSLGLDSQTIVELVLTVEPGGRQSAAALVALGTSRALPVVPGNDLLTGPSQKCTVYKVRP